MMPRLKDKYQNEVVPALIDRFKYKNVRMVPRINKITINMGVGAAVQDAKAMDSAVKDLTTISGQKPVITRAKKSVAAFRAAGRHARRLKGNTAGRPHVGVLR